MPQNKPGITGRIFKSIKNKFKEPRVDQLDVDSNELLETQRKLLEEKAILRSAFDESYHTCARLDEEFLSGSGDRVEVGAGVSRFKELYPHIVSTDIKEAKHLDMALDAQNMSFGDESIRSIYAINCFHHMPEPRKFLSEVNRVLHSGGGCIMVEPYYGPLASFVFKHLFETETFDKKQESWEGQEMSVMKGANQALSYVVFKRDRKEFEKEFPDLEIVHQRTMSSMVRYFISGGVNFRQLLPDWTLPGVKMFEKIISPLEPIYAVQHVLVIRKK